MKAMKADTSGIQSMDDVDERLAYMASLQDRIRSIEIEWREAIRKAEASMVEDTAGFRGNLEAEAEALETWAKKNKAEIFPDGKKSLELTRGVVGFRKGKSKIKLVLAIENIVAHLKARAMAHCIRIVEEPDLLQLANYDDDQLEAVGLKRTNPKDKFFYELKKTEVRP